LGEGIFPPINEEHDAIKERGQKEESNPRMPKMRRFASEDLFSNMNSPARTATSLGFDVTKNAMNKGLNFMGLESTNKSLRFSFTSPLISKVKKRMKANNQSDGSKHAGKERASYLEM
jgi:hypothetical protein